ncbi:hypothetical protein Slin14017_G018440 [Septoria linicola]|nr:hypothetical protein Slin14017_G018440 [Septoria linicola]
MSGSISEMSSSATSASATATDSGTTYDFSIKEATIRNTAIGVCLALFVFLVCALVGLEIMRRRVKRMRKLIRSLSPEEGQSTQYLSPTRSMKMESPATSDDVRYQLISPVVRAPERSVTEISGQGEVFESDARSVHSFHRGSTHKHNKNISSKWYGLRGHMN